MKLYIKSVLLLLLTLSTSNLYAKLLGQPLIDSLLKDLPRQKEDTNKVNLLTAVSFAYITINPAESMKYAQLALETATKLDWKKGIANANNRIGVSYQSKSDFPKALEYFDKALKIRKEIGDKSGAANTIGNIGYTYKSLSDYPKALGYYQEALKLFEEIGDKSGVARFSGHIGFVYQIQSDYPRALEYFFKTLKIHEELGDKSNIGATYGNIGTVYVRQSDYPKALEYFLKALEIEEATGDKPDIAAIAGNIGLTYCDQGDYAKALEYDFKALKIDEEIGNKNAFASVTGNIGLVYQQQKNYTMAVEYYQKALKMDDEVGDKYDAAISLCDIGNCFLSIIEDTPAKTNTTEPSERKYVPNGAIPAGKAALLHSAIDYLHRSLVISKELHAMYILKDCYYNLAEAYKLSGDYKKAMEYADSTRIIKDSVFSQENSQKMAKLENARKEYGDSLKTAAAKRAMDIKAEHRRNYELIGVGALVLAIGFIFAVTRNNKLLSKERKRSDNLLLNILPEEVADQLKDTGKSAARQFDDVTVLFTDFVNFTEAGERMKPQALIDELHTCFKAFDDITTKYSVEKIKTIGDAYLAVAGLPTPDPKHAENIVRAAVEINAFMRDRVAKLGNSTFEIRIGIHSGSVVAGIVGVKKFAYDIWGDTVNTAARMEQNSEAGKINISQTTYELVKDKFNCEYRGEIDAKGKGMLKMYYING